MQAIETKLNGIDTQALRKTIAVVSENPAAAVAGFQVTTRWAGATRSRTHVCSWELGHRKLSKDFTIAADEPKELLGDNTAPNPQELLMAGLNACMTVGYVAGCAMRGIRLESLEIETHGQLDLRGFLGLDPSIKPGYDEVRYTVRIKGDGTEEQFREVHRTVMATSPNFWNFAHPIKLSPTLVVE